MDKINFQDGEILDAEKLNNMQNNIETAIDSKPSTPPGGTTGQILAKASDADNDTEWIDNTGGESGDSLPTNSVIAFDGDTIPEGYEEVEEADKIVTDSLEGNSTTQAPSVRAVNDGLNNKQNTLVTEDLTSQLYDFNSTMLSKNGCLLKYGNVIFLEYTITKNSDWTSGTVLFKIPSELAPSYIVECSMTKNQSGKTGRVYISPTGELKIGGDVASTDWIRFNATWIILD